MCCPAISWAMHVAALPPNGEADKGAVGVLGRNLSRKDSCVLVSCNCIVNIKAAASDRIAHELQERYMTGSICWPFKGDTAGNGVVITEHSFECFSSLWTLRSSSLRILSRRFLQQLAGRVCVPFMNKYTALWDPNLMFSIWSQNWGLFRSYVTFPWRIFLKS